MSKKNIIRLSLGVVLLISSFLSWFLLSNVLAGRPEWLGQSLWALAGFLFLGIVVGLVFLLEDSQLIFYALPALTVLPALVFLKNSLITGVVAAVAIAFLALGVWRADFEKALRIEHVSWIILKRGFGPAITALALLITLFFYWSPWTQSLQEKIYIPRPLFNAIAEPAMDVFLRLSLQPGTDIDLSSPEFKKQQTQFLNELYQSANEQISSAGQASKKWLPLGISVSLFFSFKIIGTFLSYLMIALAWMIFKLLLWFKVVKIERVAAEKEVIII